jgi:hypothetical protein
VFDNSAESQDLLPGEALQADDGTRLDVSGALRFQLQDESGRIAGQFGAQENENGVIMNKDSHADTTVVTADLPEVGDGQPVLVFFNAETGEMETVELPTESVTTTSKDGKRHFSRRFGFFGRSLFWGRARFRPPSFFWRRGGGRFGICVYPPARCRAQGALNINRNGQRGPITVAFRGGALSGSRTFNNPAQSFRVSASSFFRGQIRRVNSLRVTVTAPDGQTVSVNVNPCNGQANVTLPAPAADRIQATVVVEPNCPGDDIIPISGNVDGYSVNYRLASATGQPFNTASNEDIRVFTTGTPSRFQRAEVDVFNVLANEDYLFVGTFDTESSRKTITMPSSDGGTLTTTDDELNDLCE